jgi:hypothetical protein
LCVDGAILNLHSEMVFALSAPEARGSYVRLLRGTSVPQPLPFWVLSVHPTTATNPLNPSGAVLCRYKL